MVGRFALNTKDDNTKSYGIKKQLFLKSEDFGKVKYMHIVYMLLFRILIGYLIPRE